MRTGALFAYEPTIRLAAFAAVFVVWRFGNWWRRAGGKPSGAAGAGPTISASWSSTRCWCASSFPPRPSAWPSLPRRRAWALQRGRVPCVDRGGAVGRDPRSRHLSAARAVPRGAGAVAAAPHASCRSRIRCHDRAALPPDRDPAVDGDQARRRSPRSAHRRSRADLRGAAQRHLDVQPRQRAHARGSTACCAGSW